MNKIIQGDALEVLKTLESESVQTCITSPPYFGLRDYGMPGQIGLEETPDAFVSKLVELFREVRRVLRDDGTLWLNLGDSYASTKGRGEIRESPTSAYMNKYTQHDLCVLFLVDRGGWLESYKLNGVPYKSYFLGSQSDKRMIELFGKVTDAAFKTTERKIDGNIYTIETKKDGNRRVYRAFLSQQRMVSKVIEKDGKYFEVKVPV